MPFSDNFPHNSYVLSSKIQTPVSIDLPDSEAEIVTEYEDKFRTYGLIFESSNVPNNNVLNECNEKQKTGTILNISHVPACFVWRHENESKYGRIFSILKITTILVKEIVDKIRCTRGGGLGILPKTILEVLSSRACRGMNVTTSFLYYLETGGNIRKIKSRNSISVYTPLKQNVLRC